MALTMIPASTITNANTIGLGISSTSLYKPNFESVTQSIEDLKFLLLTHIGEIPNMEPNFGTRLLFVLFEPNSNSTDLKENIDNIIKTAVTRWLPEIDIQKIDITTSEDDPTLSHNVVIKLTIKIQLLKDNAVVEIAANNSGTIIVSSHIGTENGK
jgi:phage baseplate assembly protein W